LDYIYILPTHTVMQANKKVVVGKVADISPAERQTQVLRNL
jgi:hypothetical protein